MDGGPRRRPGDEAARGAPVGGGRAPHGGAAVGGVGGHVDLAAVGVHLVGVGVARDLGARLDLGAPAPARRRHARREREDQGRRDPLAAAEASAEEQARADGYSTLRLRSTRTDEPFFVRAGFVVTGAGEYALPGGASLHNSWTPHGPDAETHERASAAELKPHKLTDTMAFMFESRFAMRLTRYAIESAELLESYYVWPFLERILDVPTQVIVAEGECQLERQRRIKPWLAGLLARGERVERVKYGVDEDVCNGDHACIRLSGCPTLTLKDNPDPLKVDPVATVIDGCVGCGLCGANAHAATLCPSFYRAEVMQKQANRMKTLAETNQKAGDAFLAENAKKEGVVSLPSGLQYKVIKAGTGKKPKATDTVTTHYRGTLIDGTEFDSSISRGKPASFPVTGVIPGWTEALQLMEEQAVSSEPLRLAHGGRRVAVMGAGELPESRAAHDRVE